MFKSKKRVLALIMVALLTASAVGTSVAFIPNNTGIVANAEEALSNNFDYEVIDNNVTITGYQGRDKDVVIPATIKGYDVTAIGAYAFKGKSFIESITIPASVRNVGSSAFNGCSGLKKTIYTGSIDHWAEIEFTIAYDGDASNPVYQSKNLYINDSLVTDVTLSAAAKVSSGAFHGCESLTSITIKEGAASIGERAFSGCKNLSTITIPASVKSIGHASFDNCNGLTKTNYTGTIDQWAQIEFGHIIFGGSYYYPSNPVSFSKNLYINDVLVENLNLTTAERISQFSFIGCDSIKSVTFGDSVESIGSYSFFNCKGLTSATFGKNVYCIWGEAFQNCTALKSVSMENGIRYIWEKAFDIKDPETSQTKNIEELHFHGTTDEWNTVLNSTKENNDSLLNAEQKNFYHDNINYQSDNEKHWFLCGYTGENEEEAHKWGNLKIITPPTETTAGKATATCKICKQTYDIDIPAGSVIINKENFPDDTFRKIVSDYYDPDGKGFLTPDDIKEIDYFYGGDKGINSFEGIEFFKDLEELYSMGNNIETIDISENKELESLSIYELNLKELDISNNPKLVELVRNNPRGYYKDDDSENYYYYDEVTDKGIGYLPTTRLIVFKVNYEMNGHGTQVTTQGYDKDEKLVKPSDPTAQGYAFIGWYYDQALTKPVDFDNDTVKDNMTLYAKWDKASTCTLNFVTNGGSKINSLTKPEGTTINLNSYKPTRSGYSFEGWYSDAKLTKKVTSVTLNDKTTVYAKWAALPMDKTEVKSILNTDYGIKLAWNKSKNADGYKIYRKGADNKWEIIAVIKGANNTSYLNKRVLNGTRYTYAVRAYNGRGLSDYSTKTTLRVVCPQLVYAKNTGSGTVKIDVLSHHNSKAYGYVISYRTGNQTKYIRTYAMMNNSAILKNLQKGKTYEIKVRAYRIVGKTISYSCWSQPKYVTIKK